MTNAIIVEDLQKRFGSVVALDGVDFSVPTGTVLGLLGPNGAGKTTSVRVLTTILAPRRRAGPRCSVSTSTEHAQAVRERIGLAGQYAAVDENLTGHENLRMVGRLSHLAKPVDRWRGRRSCSNASPWPTRPTVPCAPTPAACAAGSTSPPRSLHRPPVLFLDEPTTGLDPSGRQDLWGVIEELVREGTTLLLTTQYLEEADRLADNIVVIDHGQRHRGGHVVGAQGDARRDDRRGRASPTPATAQARAVGAAPASACATSAARRPLGRAQGRRRRPGRARRRARARPRAPRTDRRSTCASPRSTTCSCRSPATKPKSAVAEDAAGRAGRRRTRGAA